MEPKEQIIDLFRQNVRGHIPDVFGKNERHDGRKRSLARTAIWNYCKC